MDFFESVAYNLVAIVAILSPILLIIAILVYSYKKEQNRNRLIRELMEKGENPEAIIPLIDKGKTEDKNPTKHFRSGVTLLAVGLGFVLTWLLADWGSMHAIGAFLAVLGIGEIVIAWYLRKYSK